MRMTIASLVVATLLGSGAAPASALMLSSGAARVAHTGADAGLVHAVQYRDEYRYDRRARRELRRDRRDDEISQYELRRDRRQAETRRERRFDRRDVWDAPREFRRDRRDRREVRQDRRRDRREYVPGPGLRYYYVRNGRQYYRNSRGDEVLVGVVGR